MDRHHRLDAARDQRLDHLAVVIQASRENLPSSGSIRLHSSEKRWALWCSERARSKSDSKRR